MEKQINLWMPVTKTASGKFMGILSDTSIDRDGEFMSKELLQEWARNASVKALVNHENKMEKWVGGWKGFKLVEKGNNTALVAEPWFFSKEANPLAEQVRKQVEESLANGENAGISIGALPLESIEKEIDGKTHRGYTKAELLEGTWVPIQSNRNAMSFSRMAKHFDINSNENTEEIIMTKEIKKESPEEAVPVEEKLAEVEAKAEEVAEEPKEEEVEAEEPVVEEAADKSVQELEQLKKEVEELKKYKEQAILKGTVEGPAVSTKIVEPTLVNLMKAMHGGQ